MSKGPPSAGERRDCKPTFVAQVAQDERAGQTVFSADGQ